MIIQTQYESILINDAIQKLNSIRVRLRTTQEMGRNMEWYRQQQIKKIDTVVSNLFLFDYLLCDCRKLYLFVNNTKQDAYHKAHFYESSVHYSLF
jgi:ribosomal 50S subunit-associated protein YjgA (DUF615 family)